jgi:uncharacterized protein
MGSLFMERNFALELVKSHSKKRYMFCHMLEVEAIMKALAEAFGEDEKSWGMAGLIHDIDFEETEHAPQDHGKKAEGILKDLVSSDVMDAVKAHNFEYTMVLPESKLAKSLVAADAIAGLLVACALVMPSKKLSEVKVETVEKKFKDKDFARGVDRNRILYCERIGVEKTEFIRIALKGLRKIGNEIGL